MARLPLERPGRVNQQIRPMLPDPLAQFVATGIQLCAFNRHGAGFTQMCRGLTRARFITSGNEQMAILAGCQRLRDPATEMTVAAQNQNSIGPFAAHGYNA